MDNLERDNYGENVNVEPFVPELYFIIHNISKRNNVRSLLKSALAFGVHTILVAGQRNFDFEPHDDVECNVEGARSTAGDLPRGPVRDAVRRGSLRILRYRKFSELVEAASAPPLNARVVAVEIVDDAVALDDTDAHLENIFRGTAEICGRRRNVALLMGNEGTGLSDRQLDLCRKSGGVVATIPQYGGGTASLNVNVAACVVLQRFVQWRDAEVGIIEMGKVMTIDGMTEKMI
uniref:tRNA/rRNA methyltransferase SpoU type domain-containing protein n=1 Tax=Corethron hystrix TaxID=216773 RepID=A0A7S1BJ72_9STRA|mmetsp:Transcript_28510/g.65207  ORF Transcript_28510/g.65207 Transcript_28510/m.65207 type:complete len:234 (+) Transcript_28510:95-796(+)